MWLRVSWTVLCCAHLLLLQLHVAKALLLLAVTVTQQHL